ncbi:hypothetical protein DRN73_08420 [Candidatus Pacearchaeota archaeon]|nr:MAG: hypothetical protein DRN73_08420 [Candidatus Pacearchaeota archaeon]
MAQKIEHKIFEIGKGFYLIKSNEKDFNRNIYLKKFEKNGRVISMLFDPGTILDITYLEDVLKNLIGGVEKLNFIFLSHQDPDVSSNSLYFISKSKSLIISSIDTLRFIKMYGIPENRVVPIENFKSMKVKIKSTGHIIEFLPANFCHFKGAYMVYDYETRILFSGDFLSGLNTKFSGDIFADEDSWLGISLFHQIYMPSSHAIKNTVNRIKNLTPFPVLIAPQHGDLIKDRYIKLFLERLENLKVGIELLGKSTPQKEMLILALLHFFQFLRKEHFEIYRNFVEDLKRPGNFTLPFEFSKDNIIEIKTDVSQALEYIRFKLKSSIPREYLKKILDKYNEYLKIFGIKVEKEGL